MRGWNTRLVFSAVVGIAMLTGLGWGHAQGRVEGSSTTQTIGTTYRYHTLAKPADDPPYRGLSGNTRFSLAPMSSQFVKVEFDFFDAQPTTEVTPAVECPGAQAMPIHDRVFTGQNVLKDDPASVKLRWLVLNWSSVPRTCELKAIFINHRADAGDGTIRLDGSSSMTVTPVNCCGQTIELRQIPVDQSVTHVALTSVDLASNPDSTVKVAGGIGTSSCIRKEAWHQCDGAGRVTGKGKALMGAHLWGQQLNADGSQCSVNPARELEPLQKFPVSDAVHHFKINISSTFTLDSRCTSRRAVFWVRATANAPGKEEYNSWIIEPNQTLLTVYQPS